MIKEKIKNQPIEKEPLIIKNYPYGFKRTLKKYWIETTKREQREVTQTLNPKTQKWNNPKKSTYSDIMILYQDENNHIHNYSLNIAYSDEENLKKFEENFKEEDLSDYQKEKIKFFKAILKTRKHIKYNIITNPTEEEQAKIEEKEQETKKEIGKIFNHYAKSEGVKSDTIK